LDEGEENLEGVDDADVSGSNVLPQTTDTNCTCSSSFLMMHHLR